MMRMEGEDVVSGRLLPPCVVSALFCLLKLGGRTAERSLVWTLAKDESFCHGQVFCEILA